MWKDSNLLAFATGLQPAPSAAREHIHILAAREGIKPPSSVLETEVISIYDQAKLAEAKRIELSAITLARRSKPLCTLYASLHR